MRLTPDQISSLRSKTRTCLVCGVRVIPVPTPSDYLFYGQHSWTNYNLDGEVHAHACDREALVPPYNPDEATGYNERDTMRRDSMRTVGKIKTAPAPKKPKVEYLVEPGERVVILD